MSKGPAARPPRMKNSVGFVIMGVFAVCVFAYSGWNNKTTIRLHLVNDSKLILSDVRVVHALTDIEAAHLSVDKPLDVELAPKLSEPIVIQFNDPQGNPYILQYDLSKMADVPRPGDTFQVSIAKVENHVVEAAPEVMPGSDILHSIRKFFGG